MKAISLDEPWASMVMSGVKQYETRSWPPPRQRIDTLVAIHATKNTKDGFGPTRHSRRRTEVQEYLASFVDGKFHVDDYDLGCVIGTARLAAAHRVVGPAPTTAKLPRRPDYRYRWIEVHDGRGVNPLVRGIRGEQNVWDQEPQFVEVAWATGDFTEGRWVWLFDEVKPFLNPIPCRGFQSFWEWTPPPGWTPPGRV